MGTAATENGCRVFNHGRRAALVLRSTITDNIPLVSQVVQRLFGVMSFAGLPRTRRRHLAAIPPLGHWCDFLGCGDILTFRRAPVLVAVECRTSGNVETAPISAWGLCANDADFDQDGALNEADGCDVDPTCDSEDADTDTVGDCCDNCVATANAQQLDFDLDGQGDECDPDIDDDGTLNGPDLCDRNRVCAIEDGDATRSAIAARTVSQWPMPTS